MKKVESFSVTVFESKRNKLKSCSRKLLKAFKQFMLLYDSLGYLWDMKLTTIFIFKIIRFDHVKSSFKETNFPKIFRKKGKLYETIVLHDAIEDKYLKLSFPLLPQILIESAIHMVNMWYSC